MNSTPNSVEAGSRLSQGEVNALVAAYFDEAGLAHSAFTLRQESRLDAIRLDGGAPLSTLPVPPGQLVRILLKGLLYLEAEARWRGENVEDAPPRLMGYALPPATPFRPIPREPPSGSSPPLDSPVESGPQSPAEIRARSRTKTPRASPPLSMDSMSARMDAEPVASTSKVQLDAPLPVNGTSTGPLSPEDVSHSPSISMVAKRMDQTSSDPGDAMDVDSRDHPPPMPDESEVRDGKRQKVDVKLELPEATLAQLSNHVSASPPGSRPVTPLARPVSASGQRKSPSPAINAPGSYIPPTPAIPDKSTSQPPSRPSSAKGPDDARRSGTLLGNSSTLLSVGGPLGNSRGRQAGLSSVSVSVKTVTTAIAQSPVSAPARIPSLPAAVLPQSRRSASPVTKRKARSRSPSASKSPLPQETLPVVHKSKSSTKTKSKGQDAAFNHKTAVTNGIEGGEQLRGPDPDIYVPESAVVRFAGAPPKYCSSPCAFNNELLATGSNDSQMRIYEVPITGGGPEIEEHANGKHAQGAKKIEIPCAAWNSPGTLLATGSEDGVVRCWTVIGELSGVLTMHQGSVWTLSWHSDGTRLLTGAHDYSVILWDAGTTHMKQNWTTHTDRVMCVEWIDDQFWASCSRDGQVHSRASPVSRLRGHTDDVNFIRVDPSRELLASCSSDETVRVWSLIGLAGSRASEGSPDDEAADIPELKRRGGVIVLRGHTNEVHQLAWQPSSSLGGHPRVLASVSSDLTARVWDVDQGTCIYLLDRHVHEIYSLAFQPVSGDILVLGSNDGRVSFWSMKDGHQIAEYLHSSHDAAGDDRRVYEVVWHPKRNQVAVTGTGTAVLLLDEIPKLLSRLGGPVA